MCKPEPKPEPEPEPEPNYLVRLCIITTKESEPEPEPEPELSGSGLDNLETGSGRVIKPEKSGSCLTYPHLLSGFFGFGSGSGCGTLHETLNIQCPQISALI